MFDTLRTALKLAGTVQELNARLTELEGNFDILDRAVKREAARARAENSRSRRADLEASAETEEGPTESRSVTKPIGGIMKTRAANGR